VGVVLYIMLSGKVPFPGESNKEIIENVVKAQYHFNYDAFKNVSDLAKDLISRLLVKDVNARYSADDAYNHPWIQNVQELPNSELAIDAFENMKNFMEAVSFKKTTLIYLAQKLPEKYIEELRKAFIQIDTDGDGSINRAEFKAALDKAGHQYSEIEIS